MWLGLQATISGSGVSGGRCDVMGSAAEIVFGDVAVGAATKLVLTLENTSPTPTVFEVCLLYS